MISMSKKNLEDLAKLPEAQIIEWIQKNMNVEGIIQDALIEQMGNAFYGDDFNYEAYKRFKNLEKLYGDER